MKHGTRASRRPRGRPAAKRPGGTGSIALSAGILALLAIPTDIGAQMVGPHMASRDRLEAMEDSLRVAAASADDGDRQAELENQLSGLRYRLEQGDIWPGDIVALEVSGEERWTDSFTVTPQRTLELPDIADPIPLEGVLYSEAEETLARELSRYLREPRLRVHVLKRVAILGQVGSPGFYHLPGSALLSDAVMRAGGPGAEAKLRDVEIRRNGDRVAEGFPQVAFQRLSLDQLGIVSGDEVFVPKKPGSPWRVFLGVLGGVTSITFLLVRIL